MSEISVEPDPYTAAVGDLVCFQPGALERVGVDVYYLLEMEKLYGHPVVGEMTGQFRQLREPVVGVVLYEFGNTLTAALTPDGVRMFASSSWGAFMFVLLRKECG
jgi:hypothetical protein